MSAGRLARLGYRLWGEGKESVEMVWHSESPETLGWEEVRGAEKVGGAPHRNITTAPQRRDGVAGVTE